MDVTAVTVELPVLFEGENWADAGLAAWIAEAFLWAEDEGQHAAFITDVTGLFGEGDLAVWCGDVEVVTDDFHGVVRVNAHPSGRVYACLVD